MGGFKLRNVLIAAVMVASCSGWALETIAITEYMNDPRGSQTTDEWVELYNYGATTVTLAAWHLTDDDSDSGAIPTNSIAPGDFLILARNKAGFEAIWTAGVSDARVLQISNFAMNDGGGTTGDEIVLKNAASQVVWRLGYGPGDSHGRAVFYALDDLATTNTNHGAKASTTWINLNGNDLATGRLDYEGNQYTPDVLAYTSASGDYGSPLRGAYSGAHNPPPQPTSYSLDLDGPTQHISQGVRGLAIADQALNRGDNSDKTGIIPCLERVTGSALRGVAGGLYADLYDWKRRNDMPRPPTLEFQRWARDTSATLYVTANIRGLTEPDPAQPGFRRYYTSDTLTLANLAADWVRYTNHIVQTYRQGDTVTDTRDATILNELTWSSSYVNQFGTADNFTKLLAPGEAAVPPVIWWEIGNEPTVSLEHAYSVTNAFTFADDPAEYANRYVAITAAMLAEDPTIKVGPCVVNGRAGKNAAEIAAVLQSGAQVDFISYHPYTKLGDWPDEPLRQQEYLGGVYASQAQFLKEVKDLVALYRPELVNTMKYVASETNVSNYPSNNTFQEGCMAHALGSVETIMSFARLGLEAAHYWIWITATPTYLADSNRFAVSMAWEKLRDELGDELIGAFDANDKVRLYVIRDSDTGVVKVWAMNFSNSDDLAFHINLSGGPGPLNTIIKKTVLQAIGGGPTNLFSANLNPEINNTVPRRDVDWSPTITTLGVDLQNWDVLLPSATLTLYTIENTAPAGIGNWTLY